MALLNVKLQQQITPHVRHLCPPEVCSSFCDVIVTDAGNSMLSHLIYPFGNLYIDIICPI